MSSRRRNGGGLLAILPEGTRLGTAYTCRDPVTTHSVRKVWREAG